MCGKREQYETWALDAWMRELCAPRWTEWVGEVRKQPDFDGVRSVLCPIFPIRTLPTPLCLGLFSLPETAAPQVSGFGHRER